MTKMNFKKLNFLMIFCCLSWNGFSQFFPQQAINDALQNRSNAQTPAHANPSITTGSNNSGITAFMKNTPVLLEKINSRIQQGISSQAIDTLFVGIVPNDTVVITGTYVNNGPILVFNDGVLIFENANATILGDIFVFQDGKFFCDSSILYSPQQYFYQRTLLLAHNGEVNISNSTLDYSGLSHSMAVVNNANVTLTNINNIGFTTAGAYENASITINGSNQAGEFIMTDSASFSFSDANTVLLWHHIPDGGIVDHSFPSGASVASYNFSNSLPGVSNVFFSVQVNNCTDVMWALMPENGSDVTITGSTLRAIGLWFVGNDTSNVSGLVNNSNYVSFTAPLSDRLLQLNTTSVQTWSLYMFNTVSVNITGCIVGEVGSMGTSFVTATGILCDGSGGYYWGNDTSFNFAVSSTVLGTIRSEKNGIVLLGYGSASTGAVAIDNSIMVVTQSNLPADPVAYSKGVAWRVHINPPGTIYTNSMVNINGSAWIDQGPLGAFMDFGSYNVEYTPSAVAGWQPVSLMNTNEVHNGLLAQWNTAGLTPGAYNLRLNTLNNFGDSIDAVLQVNLLPSILGLNENENSFSLQAFYNYSESVIVTSFQLNENALVKFNVLNIVGEVVRSVEKPLSGGNNEVTISTTGLADGIYFISLQTESGMARAKVRIIR